MAVKTRIAPSPKRAKAVDDIEKGGPSDSFRKRAMAIKNTGGTHVDPTHVHQLLDTSGQTERAKLELEGQTKKENAIDNLMYESRQRANKKPWYIIDPRLSKFMTYWDSATAVRESPTATSWPDVTVPPQPA